MLAVPVTDDSYLTKRARTQPSCPSCMSSDVKYLGARVNRMSQCAFLVRHDGANFVVMNVAGQTSFTAANPISLMYMRDCSGGKSCGCF